MGRMPDRGDNHGPRHTNVLVQYSYERSAGSAPPQNFAGLCRAARPAVRCVHAMLPVHPSAAKTELVSAADRTRVAATLADLRKDAYISQHLTIAVDPRDSLHWFLHFHDLSAEPFSAFKGIYGHVQFCPIPRSNKNTISVFPQDPPAFGILTPTAIFTSYTVKPFGTGGKDIGFPGICGTMFADEKMYRLSMTNMCDGEVLQVGRTYQQGRNGKATVIDEDYLQIDGTEYSPYVLKRYKGSVTKWLTELVRLLDTNVCSRGSVVGAGLPCPRGSVVGAGFDGVSRKTDPLAISAAAAASEEWAATAFGGELLKLFRDQAGVPRSVGEGSTAEVAVGEAAAEVEAQVPQALKPSAASPTGPSEASEPPGSPETQQLKFRSRAAGSNLALELHSNQNMSTSLQVGQLLCGAPNARGKPGDGDYVLGLVLAYNSVDKKLEVQWEGLPKPVLELPRGPHVQVGLAIMQAATPEVSWAAGHEARMSHAPALLRELQPRAKKLLVKCAADEAPRWVSGKRRRVEHIDVSAGTSSSTTVVFNYDPSVQPKPSLAAEVVEVKKEILKDAEELNQHQLNHEQFQQAKLDEFLALCLNKQVGREEREQKAKGIAARTWTEWLARKS